MNLDFCIATFLDKESRAEPAAQTRPTPQGRRGSSILTFFSQASCVEGDLLFARTHLLEEHPIDQISQFGVV